MKNRLLILLLFPFLSSCFQNTQVKEEDTVSSYQYLKGQKIYQARCANCHQSNGEGLGKLYPPIAKSDYLEREKLSVVCLIKHGIQGVPMVVNGQEYNMPMLGQEDLNEVEISDLLNYIFNTWGNQLGPVTKEQVDSVLTTCSQ